MRIDGKQALVTGATGGIGHAIARALAGAGATVLLTGRRAEVLEGLASEIGGRAITADLSDRADVERLIGETADIDILVANAALPGSGPVDEYSVAEIDRALDVNLRTPMIMSKAYSERMAQRGGGQLVFISSMAGKVAPSGSAIYSATKFGLRGFGLALRQDLKGSGVGVSLVFPGFIRDAGMFADSRVELPRYVGTNTPQDVAGAVVRAIERDKAETDVAPLPVRMGGFFNALSPDGLAAFNRRLGGGEIAEAMSEGQKEKR